jgi:hypothetical protein
MPDQTTAQNVQADKPTFLRDQYRAKMAYEAVRKITEKRKEYKIAVHAFGAEILQSGLAAAMAGLERRGADGDPLRDYLAGSGIPGLVNAAASDPYSARNRPVQICPTKFVRFQQTTTSLQRAKRFRAYFG